MPDQLDAEAVEQVKLAAKALLYGYPLVYSMHEIGKFPATKRVLDAENRS